MATLPKDDPFYSAERRLLRAKEHIANLKRNLRTFTEGNPYEKVVEPDIDGVHQIYKIRLTGSIPGICDDLALEALFTLRAVLDQTGYAAAVASGKVRPKNAYFPVADDAAGLDNVIGRGRCKDLPEEILTLFCGFEPYQRGNRYIWTLNKLRNSVHTALAPIGVVPASLFASWWGDIPPFEPLKLNWDSVKNEVAFGRGKRGENPDYHIRPTFIIGFDEIELTGLMNATAVLDLATRKVESILRATKAECRRLRFIT
jgi:hypothetical protein